MRQQLDQELEEITQRIQTTGTNDAREFLAAISLIHTTATQMSQPSGDDSCTRRVLQIWLARCCIC